MKLYAIKGNLEKEYTFTTSLMCEIGDIRFTMHDILHAEGIDRSSRWSLLSHIQKVKDEVILGAAYKLTLGGNYKR